MCVKSVEKYVEITGGFQLEFVFKYKPGYKSHDLLKSAVIGWNYTIPTGEQIL